MSFPETCEISTPIQVMYFDTDAGGVVHNIAYLRFIETARTLLAIQMGMSFDEIARTKIHPVVVRTEIDYRRPALLGEIIHINGRLTEKSGARFWVEFEVVRPSDKSVLVTCRQSLALVQMPEGRLVRLPPDFPNSFAPGKPAA
jgi:YbgC/YbaW family acyl-CoA thioester hydrolase